ncbi:hypothetical protein JCM8097_007414 [Rhodosporidiobolus ruineniae]
MPRQPDPDKIPIASPRDLHNEVDALLAVLALNETEDTWEKINKAVKRFQAVVRGGATKFTDDFVQSMRDPRMVKGICRSLATERGALSGTTLELIASCTRLGSHFSVLLHPYLPTILRLFARPNKVYVNRAASTVASIVRNTRLGDVLKYIAAEWRNGEVGKSATFREQAAIAVALMLGADTGALAVEKDQLERRIDELEWVIKTGATGREASVRTEMKKCWEVYKREWPDRVASFTAPMTPTIRKYLKITEIAGASSSSSAAPTRAPPAAKKPHPLSSSTGPASHHAPPTRPLGASTTTRTAAALSTSTSSSRSHPAPELAQSHSSSTAHRAARVDGARSVSGSSGAPSSRSASRNEDHHDREREQLGASTASNTTAPPARAGFKPTAPSAKPALTGGAAPPARLASGPKRTVPSSSSSSAPSSSSAAAPAEPRRARRVAAPPPPPPPAPTPAPTPIVAPTLSALSRSQSSSAAPPPAAALSRSQTTTSGAPTSSHAPFRPKLTSSTAAAAAAGVAAAVKPKPSSLSSSASAPTRPATATAKALSTSSSSSAAPPAAAPAPPREPKQRAPLHAPTASSLRHAKPAASSSSSTAGHSATTSAATLAARERRERRQAEKAEKEAAERRRVEEKDNQEKREEEEKERLRRAREVPLPQAAVEAAAEKEEDDLAEQEHEEEEAEEQVQETPVESQDVREVVAETAVAEPAQAEAQEEAPEQVQQAEVDAPAPAHAITPPVEPASAASEEEVLKPRASSPAQEPVEDEVVHAVEEVQPELALEVEANELTPAAVIEEAQRDEAVADVEPEPMQPVEEVYPVEVAAEPVEIVQPVEVVGVVEETSFVQPIEEQQDEPAPEPVQPSEVEDHSLPHLADDLPPSPFLASASASPARDDPTPSFPSYSSPSPSPSPVAPSHLTSRPFAFHLASTPSPISRSSILAHSTPAPPARAAPSPSHFAPSAAPSPAPFTPPPASPARIVVHVPTAAFPPPATPEIEAFQTRSIILDTPPRLDDLPGAVRLPGRRVPAPVFAVSLPSRLREQKEEEVDPVEKAQGVEVAKEVQPEERVEAYESEQDEDAEEDVHPAPSSPSPRSPLSARKPSPAAAAAISHPPPIFLSEDGGSFGAYDDGETTFEQSDAEDVEEADGSLVEEEVTEMEATRGEDREFDVPLNDTSAYNYHPSPSPSPVRPAQQQQELSGDYDDSDSEAAVTPIARSPRLVPLPPSAAGLAVAPSPASVPLPSSSPTPASPAALTSHYSARPTFSSPDSNDTLDLAAVLAQQKSSRSRASASPRPMEEESAIFELSLGGLERPELRFGDEGMDSSREDEGVYGWRSEEGETTVEAPSAHEEEEEDSEDEDEEPVQEETHVLTRSLRSRVVTVDLDSTATLTAKTPARTPSMRTTRSTRKKETVLERERDVLGELQA